jgi:small conductance mechanosensitive channel
MDINKLYSRAYDWLISYGPRFLVAIAILFLGLWLIKLLSRWSTNRMQHKEVDPTVKPFLLSMVSIALRIILIIFVMEIAGIHLTLLTALIGAFGVAVGLALSGTLQNFASGVLILLLKPFVVGDNVLTQGIEGTVESIQIFYTMIKTYDNRVVIVPNSLLSNNMIVNISREGVRRLDILYKFANGVDVKQVREVLNKIIDGSEYCLKSPERRIGITLLEADAYTLSIEVWVNAHGFEDAKRIVQEAILQGLKDASIKIGGVA